MKTYSKEFKLNVVKDHIAGEGGAKLLGRKHGVSEEKVRTWVSRFRLHGEAGLSAKRSVYSTDFKLEVLYRQEREQLSSSRWRHSTTFATRIKSSAGEKGWTPRAYRRLKISAGGPPSEEGLPTILTAADVPGANDPGVTQALREENERLRGR